MPITQLQSGIGDNNDLLVRLKPGSSNQIVPEIQEGTYFTYIDGSTDIFEFTMYSDPVQLTLSSATKNALKNDRIEIPLTYVPNYKQPPYVIIKSASSVARLTVVPEIVIVDELQINLYSITRPVQSINGDSIVFGQGDFPTNVITGSTCFNIADPETQYTILSKSTSSILLDKTPVSTGTWSFSINGAGLSYPQGTPNIVKVMTITNELVTTTIDEENRYIDETGILVLPTTCSIDDDVIVTYLADGTCAYAIDPDNGNNILSVYTSQTIDAQNAIYYSYPKTTSSVWREITDVDLNPSVTGVYEGFLFIDNESAAETTPTTVTFETYPKLGQIQYITPNIFAPVTVIAKVTNSYENPVNGVDITWHYKKNDDSITEIVDATGVLATRTTSIGGYISLTVDDTFLQSISGGFASSDTITFYVYYDGSSLGNTGTIEPVEINASIKTSYVHAVKTSVNGLATITAWREEEEQVGHTWTRVAENNDEISFYKIDKNGIVSTLYDSSQNNTFTPLQVFPYTASITGIDLSDADYIYACYEDSPGTYIQSNIIKV